MNNNNNNNNKKIIILKKITTNKPKHNLKIIKVDNLHNKSTNSITSTKSNNSIKSTRSKNSIKSIRSNNSVKSTRSKNSIKSVRSKNSIKSTRSKNSIKSINSNRSAHDNNIKNIQKNNLNINNTLKIRILSRKQRERNINKEQNNKIPTPNIIRLPGRKEYDANIPREELDGHVERKPSDGYISIQKYINQNNGHINEEILNIYKNNVLIPLGFRLTPKNKILDIPVGSTMRFRKKDNTWKSGGYVVDISLSKTTYDENQNIIKDFNNKIYILYKAYNNKIYSLQEDDISELWVKKLKNPKNKPKKDNIVEYVKPAYITNYPVYLKDSNGNNVTVYYGKDNYAKNRFMETTKYKNAKKFGWRFINN